MISFAAVKKEFGDLQALREVTFEINPGGIVGLLGPNGAGKTTAMRIMTGFLAPTGGDVTFDGQPFGPDTVEARRRIGYLPESAPAYSDMLAWDYLVFEARLHGLDPHRRVPEVIREVGLGSHAHKPIRELSKGFRQRVGLAHALLHDPEVLILDEPTSGLDPNQILEVRAMIRRIAASKTVILSTHIMQEVEALCDRVIVMHRGRVRFDGPIGELSRDRRQHVRLQVRGIALEELRRRLAGVPGFREVRVVAGDLEGESRLEARIVADRATPADDIRPALFRALLREPRAGSAAATGNVGADGPTFDLYELAEERTSLEDVFHELTTDHVAQPEVPHA